MGVVALIENKDHAQKLTACLNAVGHDVHVVDRFSQAKEILHGYHCNLIVSDVHLENGGSVFDFLQWVKSDPLLSGIPFVLLSLEPTVIAKYLSDGVRITARHLGAAQYIVMEEFDPLMLRTELLRYLPKPTGPVKATLAAPTKPKLPPNAK